MRRARSATERKWSSSAGIGSSGLFRRRSQACRRSGAGGGNWRWRLTFVLDERLEVERGVIRVLRRVSAQAVELMLCGNGEASDLGFLRFGEAAAIEIQYGLRACRGFRLAFVGERRGRLRLWQGRGKRGRCG